MVEGWYRPDKARVSHFYIQGDHSKFCFTSLCGKHSIVVYGFDVMRTECPDVGCKQCRELLAAGNRVGGP